MAGNMVFNKQSKHRRGVRRIITFALAAALILALGVGAWAVYQGRVQDLVMKSSAPADIPIVGEDNGDIAIVGEDGGDVAIVDEDGTPEPARQVVRYDPLPEDTNVISLQGFAGSPEHRAALAWAEFLHGYDRDGTVLSSVGNGPTPWDEKYGNNSYFVYSQEMADALEAIAAEYGLTLHSGMTVTTIDELRGRFGDFCPKISYGSGYCYSDGTFQCDCDNGELIFQLRRCMKGTLDTVSLNVGDVEQYEQWTYTTACGETVLLALAPRHALILAESEQSFTVVNVMAGADIGFTAEPLQALADTFDFTLL